MSKKATSKFGTKIVSVLELALKKPLIDAVAIFGFVKILSLLVDRNFIPHTQYIVLILIICLYSSLTSHEKKQVYTCVIFIVTFGLFLVLKHLEWEHWSFIILELIFLGSFIYNLVFYIRKMFEFSYGKSLLPTLSFLTFYFFFVFFQPNISIEAIERPIISFSRLDITNFISINYKNNYQFDLIYTIWNVLTLLISTYSFRTQFKKPKRK